APVAKDKRLLLVNTGDILRRAVIRMVMADQNQVGSRRVRGEVPGINVYHRSVLMRRAVDSKTGMPQPVDPLQHTPSCRVSRVQHGLGVDAWGGRYTDDDLQAYRIGGHFNRSARASHDGFPTVTRRSRRPPPG